MQSPAQGTRPAGQAVGNMHSTGDRRGCQCHQAPIANIVTQETGGRLAQLAVAVTAVQTHVTREAGRLCPQSLAYSWHPGPTGALVVQAHLWEDLAQS